MTYIGEIGAVRAFNRLHTGRIGRIDRSYPGSGPTLTQVRVPHESDAAGTGIDARRIAAAPGPAREQGCARMTRRTHASHSAAC